MSDPVSPPLAAAVPPLLPPAAQFAAIVAIARSLVRDPAPGLRLAGRNLAVLSVADDPDAAAFEAAGTGLGARVARLHHEPADNDRPQALRRLGATLGHLYDAIDCLGLPGPALALLREAAGGIPVFGGISSPQHVTADLADQLDPSLPAPDRRRLVVQAILLHTLR